ncbi:phosphocholine-specific phospholipase C [Caulobacter sp. KR2-114]|uniref:phosphocholine-specific phospholipase C n=1 Tax=Caulobacter sp. KR2-114 TaxID=3400912 RepID=UPI003C0176E2
MAGQGADRGAERRTFLKAAGAAALGSALSGTIDRALALPARRGGGTIGDLEHVVILMQENRSFDHYFGTLRGVRGFADPRPLRLPGGANVFHQPRSPGSAEVVTPFHLDAAATRAQSLHSLDHSWKGSHDLWKRHDAWIAAKTDLTMGYFTRADIPFYHALADAFTVCDAYHCSIFGPTNPNRMFLFTGTSGLAAGADGPQVVANPPDELNETADPANDAKAFAAYRWPTYAERLQAAGVSWRVYQEFDNYGDNALAYFETFRGVGPGHPLFDRGRAWADGANAGNAKTSDGEHLVAAFARDVAADRLPQVSWIVPPYKLCEHPSATPAAGEHLTARLIAALTANPEVWAKTALIVNYDENDGFFDHMPPLVPPTGGAPGRSTAALDGETYHGVPVGLGPRVPMLVVSPWTKGGWVNSQTFDHTSVIRLLETRFGVAEPQITPWRRTVTGDLSSVFDFAAPDRGPRAALPDASVLPARATAQSALPEPKAPAQAQALPSQEPGARPARPLPYAFDAWMERRGGTLALTIANTGAAGAGFALYPAAAGGPGPWFYAVDAGKSLTDSLPIESAYDLTLHGPNGFLRQFGGAGAEPLSARLRDSVGGVLRVDVANSGPAPVAVRAVNAYGGQVRTARLAPGAKATLSWPLAPHGHWYDVTVSVAGDAGFLRRFAGHIETGRPSRSDPALAWSRPASA